MKYTKRGLLVSPKEYQEIKDFGWLDLFKITRGLKNTAIEMRWENGKLILPQSHAPNETIFKMVVNDNKKIYDKQYNKIKLLLTNNIFSEEVKKLREAHNVPLTGFKKYKDFKQWSECKKIPKEAKRLLENNQGKTNSSSHYFSKIEESLANNIEKSILKRFRLSRELLEPIKWFILNNNLDYDTSSFEMKFCQNNNGGNELWLKILPHTKKQDLLKLWSQIKLFQEYLPGYRGKLKEWVNIGRDYEIYKLYQKYRRELGFKRRSRGSISNLMSGLGLERILEKEIPEGTIPFDQYINYELKKKYPHLTTSNIRKILSRFKKNSGTYKDIL